MEPLRAILLLAVVAALATGGAVAATPAAPPVAARVDDARFASAADAEVAVVRYPALVSKRLARTQKLLAVAAQYQDIGDSEQAVRSLAAIRSNLRKAWDGAKFAIQTAAGEPPFADPHAIAAAVLSLQHEVAATAIAMLDTASATLLEAVSTSLFAALNERDAAVEYIHSLPSAGWSAVTSNVLLDLDDELLQVDGVRALVNLSPGRKRLLDLIELQDTKSAQAINSYWPPLATDG